MLECDCQQITISELSDFSVPDHLLFIYISGLTGYLHDLVIRHRIHALRVAIQERPGEDDSEDDSPDCSQRWIRHGGNENPEV